MFFCVYLPLSKSLPLSQYMSQDQQIDPNAVTLFAQTNFRNQQRRFGIKLDDRRRHMYVIGKTGMGKTTLLENMILSDIYAGHGCCYIDPHGDTAEKLLDFIPSWRTNDVVYFNPGDLEYPVGFNILETINEEQKHLVGAGLMGVFKKIWPDVWSPRMEYILLNCVLALLDYPGATLLGISRILVDRDFRQRVIEKIKDPIVKTFWVAEFSSWSEKYATEAIAPVQNKVGQFLSASVIRNIVAQVKSSIDTRDIMDNKKIFIVNLSKGRIGEDNMRLLGGMLITKIQLAAMERVDIPEEERNDFFLYVDEFQNFATPSFANILSEARKYRLALILAHQYIEQLDETVRDAIFGNIGTIVTFRVGSPDALYMEKEFTPTFVPEDLANLPKFGIYLKLMVDGVATEPFSALTLPPIAQRTGSTEKIIAVSRERYAIHRSEIEEKVLKWSGMEAGPLADAQKPLADMLIPGGVVSYPEIKTEDEKEQEAEAAETEAEEESAPVEYLRFSPERMAAIAKSLPPQKKEKPKFKHTCTRCGKEWEMPVQLDPSRPMYCAECLPIIREEKKVKGKVLKGAVSGSVPDGVEIKEVLEKGESVKEEKTDIFHQAMRAVEDGKPISFQKKEKPAHTPPNRPRIVMTDPNRMSEVVVDEDADEDESELIRQIEENRGVAMERRKSMTVPREESEPASQPMESSSGADAPPRSPGSGRSRNDARSFGVTERQDRGERTEDAPKRKRRKRNRPRPKPEEKKSSSSVEDHFADIERRMDEKESPDRDTEDRPSGIVFKKPQYDSERHAGSSSQGSVRPGQRIQFD